MLPEHPLGAQRVAAFDAACRAVPRRQPAPPPPPPAIELALPGGGEWRIRRAPDAALLERWRDSLRRNGATPGTWHLLFQAYDDGWTIAVPSPRQMKSVRGWNRVPRDVVEAMVTYAAAEAVGALSAVGADA
jgi:hypothetical protein